MLDGVNECWDMNTRIWNADVCPASWSPDKLCVESVAFHPVWASDNTANKPTQPLGSCGLPMYLLCNGTMKNVWLTVYLRARMCWFVCVVWISLQRCMVCRFGSLLTAYHYTRSLSVSFLATHSSSPGREKFCFFCYTVHLFCHNTPVM